MLLTCDRGNHRRTHRENNLLERRQGRNQLRLEKGCIWWATAIERGVHKPAVCLARGETRCATDGERGEGCSRNRLPRPDAGLRFDVPDPGLRPRGTCAAATAWGVCDGGGVCAGYLCTLRSLAARPVVPVDPLWGYPRCPLNSTRVEEGEVLVVPAAVNQRTPVWAGRYKVTSPECFIVRLQPFGFHQIFSHCSLLRFMALVYYIQTLSLFRWTPRLYYLLCGYGDL